MKKLLGLIGLIGSVWATVYQTPHDFLNKTLGEVPKPHFIWLSGSIKKEVNRLYGSKYPALRIRYWQKGHRTAWILKAIGKEEPITVGIAIQNHRIVQLNILEFRESRGGEVRYDFFTRQFNQLGLDHSHRLDQSIDGITGATLSVNAVKKLARLALYLDQIR